MQGRIGVRAAHALDKGRYRIVMGIALLIIGIDFMTGYFFDSFLGQRSADGNDHGNLFQQIEAYAGIAVSQAGNGSEHLVTAFNAKFPSPFTVSVRARRSTDTTAFSDKAGGK